MMKPSQDLSETDVGFFKRLFTISSFFLHIPRVGLKQQRGFFHFSSDMDILSDPDPDLRFLYSSGFYDKGCEKSAGDGGFVNEIDPFIIMQPSHLVNKDDNR